MQYVEPRDRPEQVPAITFRIDLGSPHSGAVVILGLLPDEETGKEEPFELFIDYSTEEFRDYDPNHVLDNRVHIDSITRLVSLCLRSRISPREIVKQLSGFTCHPQIRGDKSIPDGVARILSRYVEEEEDAAGK